MRWFSFSSLAVTCSQNGGGQKKCRPWQHQVHTIGINWNSLEVCSIFLWSRQFLRSWGTSFWHVDQVLCWLETVAFIKHNIPLSYFQHAYLSSHRSQQPRVFSFCTGISKKLVDVLVACEELQQQSLGMFGLMFVVLWTEEKLRWTWCTCVTWIPVCCPRFVHNWTYFNSIYPRVAGFHSLGSLAQVRQKDSKSNMPWLPSLHPVHPVRQSSSMEVRGKHVIVVFVFFSIHQLLKEIWNAHFKSKKLVSTNMKGIVILCSLIR